MPDIENIKHETSQADVSGMGAEQGSEKLDADNNSGSIDYADKSQTKGIIDALRKENAKHRTANKELSSQLTDLGGRFSKMEEGLKGMFGDSKADAAITTEEVLERATERTNELERKLEHREMMDSLNELANEFEISPDKRKYFNFLIAERAETLDEDETIPDEDLEAIAQEVKGLTANPSTSVEGSDTPAPVKHQDGEVTQSQFNNMSISERAEIFNKNPSLYERLFLESKRSKKLVSKSIG